MDFGYASLGEVKCSRSRTGEVISKICDIPRVTYWPKEDSCNLEYELGCVFVFFVELGVVFIGEDF